MLAALLAVNASLLFTSVVWAYLLFGLFEIPYYVACTNRFLYPRAMCFMVMQSSACNIRPDVVTPYYENWNNDYLGYKT